MSRYINADALITAMNTWDWQELYLPIHFKQLIDEQPTADVVELVHGEWIPIDVGDCCYRCSVCNFVRDAYLLEEDNYCPHCGARMDGGR